MALLTVLYFGDIRGSIFLERDLQNFFIPPRQFWVEEVKNFIFPLWNPYYFNGHPLFATLQPGVLYPPSVLYLFLPFDWAFNLNIELHFALAGCFTYFLVRAMNASQGAALISAIAFMLSGYMISVHNLLSTLLSVTWVPLFFLCYFSAIKNNRTCHAIIAGIIGTVMFLGGGIEVCYLSFGVAFFLTLFPQVIGLSDDLIKIRRRLVLFTIFCAVFFGVAAVQLLPFLELSELSIRSKGLAYWKAGTWSLHPYDLVEFFLPDQYGLATDIKKYWAFENWLKTIYMGAIPFILAGFFLKKWDTRALGFLLIFIGSLSLAMGKNTLFHHFLYDYLPFFNKIRYPVKFIFLAVLILSVVAGLGYDYFKKDCEEKKSKNLAWPNYVLTLGFIFMIAFGILNIFNEPITASLQEIGWDQPKYNATATNLFNFKRFLVFTSLFFLGLFLYSTEKFKKPYILITLMALLILDLYFAHANYYHKEEFKQIQETGENAKFILSDPEVFRIYVTAETSKKTREFKKNGKKLDFRKEKFMLGLLGNQRILNIDGIGVTQQQRWKDFTHLIKTAPEVDNTNLLNMLNVKYVVSIPAITSPNYELVHSHEPIPQDPKEREEFEESATLKIYKNKTSLAHAFLVPQCRVLNTAREYKETFERKDFNPEQILLLDAEPKNFPCSEEKGSEKKGSVQIDSYQSNTLDISVNLPSRQFLFLSDSYFPGWKAYVDGKEREILRANYLFRAVIIEPGEHKVHFSYEPFSFKLGLAISLTTLLICGVFCWRNKTRKIIPDTQQ